ncbi:MAG: hypothetical protein JOZ56_06905 [Actinobacteria bacterium]|nr:hypothetical protein [Actinomycetota bacterium]MBV8562801.1 hypothetical protein [Actinomycetota bacterium]
MEHLVRGLAASTRQNALAYGYSLALTSTFGILATIDRPPTVGDVFLFATGAAITFTLATTVVTRGFRVHHEEEPPVVQILGASFSVVSITGSVGAAALVGWAAPHWVAWLVGAFVASGAYLVLAAVEIAVARVLRERRGLQLERIGGSG